MHDLILRRRGSFFIVLFIALLAPLLFASAAPENTPGVDRLTAVGKLWVTVRYFHPYLAYQNIDWDKAFCDTLPAIRQAKTPEEYTAALQRMLDPLHDPATHTFIVKRESTAERPGETLHVEQRANGTVIVSAVPADSSKTPGEEAQAKSLRDAIDHASTIVFDLRASNLLSSILEDPAIAGGLTATALDLPGERRWVHNGLKPYRGTSGGTYYSAFLVKSGEPLAGTPNLPDRHVSFLLGEGSRLPSIGSALWLAGKAAVLSESDHMVTDNPQTVSIPMGDNVEAVVRLSEPLTAEGKTFPAPTIVSPNGSLDSAVRAAQHPVAQQAGRVLPLLPMEPVDKAYMDSPYPSVELRILAACKIWGAFRYFYAYRDLMDEDWDADFAEFLPRFEEAKNTREYNLALSEMVVRVDDSHATVESEDLSAYFGAAPLPLRLRLIEKKPVVTRVLDEAKAAGIAPGDIVVKIDDQDAIERANIGAKYVSASTRAWLGERVMERLLNGPENSAVTLTLRIAGGQEKQVKLKRSEAYFERLAAERDGDVLRLLPGGIGYADLDRLSRDQVDPMFEKFHDAKAIILDLRGRASAGVEVAGRLARETGLSGAIVNGPLTLRPDLPADESLTQSASYFFVQTFPKSVKPRYDGKTVILVDERTIGPSERAGLFFESADNPAFIGSPSAGAISDLSNFVIPGGIVIGLSGRDIRHGNSGQIQRLGFQPSVVAGPTINGIRKGNDEVLDKAIEYVSAQ
ncbi:MAG TPA: hypothetical protein VH325_09265 [Bryobacteraceae bacterium]|jgi:C-terminal processing protease CtpA/Prc|nr:hypothetical protein [Bryobacteraceae bacterium]